MAFEATTQSQDGDQTILLRDNNTGTSAEIYAFGGLLNAYSILVNDRSQNLVEGFSSVKDARENILNGFKSAKLSPFVCRMRGGHYQFNKQDLKVNKHFMGEHAIHGLVYDAPFKIIHAGSDETKAFVELEYQYKGMDVGYPFPYELRVRWQLETDNRLTVTTTVEHHNHSTIPYADGWHPYFTLGGTVDDCTLQFDSHQQLEYDADLLPTGKLFSDRRFEKGSLLKGIELDNSFELDGNEPGCTLSNQQIRLQIIPDTSYPILQIYIPPHRKSIAIENLSGAPDNFNNRIHLLLLEPGVEHVFSTTYKAAAL
jgi:aldose 1-epimerase